MWMRISQLTLKAQLNFMMERVALKEKEMGHLSLDYIPLRNIVSS